MTPTTKPQAGVLSDKRIEEIAAACELHRSYAEILKVFARAIEAEVLRRATLTTSGASQPEPLQRLLEYCDESDNAQYGTLSVSLVRMLVNDALAAPQAGASQPESISRDAALWRTMLGFYIDHGRFPRYPEIGLQDDPILLEQHVLALAAPQAAPVDPAGVHVDPAAPLVDQAKSSGTFPDAADGGAGK